MAIQIGPIFIAGSLQNCSFYKADGKYLVRSKAGPGSKMVKTSPKFSNFRREGKGFGSISALAASFYHTLPRHVKARFVCQRLAGKLNLWRRRGKTNAELLNMLEAWRPNAPDVSSFPVPVATHNDC